MTENETPEKVGITEPLLGVLGEASPSTIFSEPEQVGDSIVYTAAAWERAGGFGFGSGSGGSDEESGAGEGGGGGGSTQGRPVAVIRVHDGGIEVEPVVDFTKIGVTFLFAAAGWLTMRRRSG